MSGGFFTVRYVSYLKIKVRFISDTYLTYFKNRDIGIRLYLNLQESETHISNKVKTVQIEIKA